MKYFILFLTIFGATQTFTTLKSVTFVDTVPSGFVNISSPLPYEFCEASVENRKVKINSIDIKNLAPGKTVSVTVSVTANEEVSVAKENISVISNFPLPSEDIPINKSAKAGETVELTVEHYIPWFIPRGTYPIKALSLGPNGEELECLRLSVHL